MRKVLDLANNQEGIPRIMEIISAVEFPVIDFSEREPEEKDKDMADSLESFMDDFFSMIKKNSKMLSAVMELMVDYIIVCWDRRSDLQFKICEKCCHTDSYRYIEGQSHQQLVNKILQKILVLLKDKTYPWGRTSVSRIFSRTTEAAVKAFKNGKQISEEDNKLFIVIPEELATRDFVNEDDLYSTVFKDMFHDLLNGLFNTEFTEVILKTMVDEDIGDSTGAHSTIMVLHYVSEAYHIPRG
ncbi:hypothetical protein ScPMuIL_017723 [Solemya velum]